MRRGDGLPKFLGMTTEKRRPRRKGNSRSGPADGAFGIEGDNDNHTTAADTAAIAPGMPGLSATASRSVKSTDATGDDGTPPPASPLSPPAPPKLLARLREALRVRHYSIRTEQAYVEWTRRFIHFHAMRHPASLGAPEVQAFLTHLAVDRSVASPTQNQAKSALLFLYREVLGVQLPWLDEIVGAKMARRLPVVLTPSEVRSLLSHLSGGTMGLLARAALRHRHAAARGPAPAREGCRVRAPRDRRARRQGRQGPRHRAAREPGVAAAGAPVERARVAPARSRGRARPVWLPDALERQVPECGAAMGLAVGVSVERARRSIRARAPSTATT